MEQKKGTNGCLKWGLICLCAAIGAFVFLGVIAVIFSDGSQQAPSSEPKKEQLAKDSLRPVEEDLPEAEAEAETPQIDSITWEIQTEMDEMTDTKNIWASIRSDNYVEQDFPYQGLTYASITVRYMKKYGYDVLIGIDQGQIVGIDVNGSNYITARFDDAAPRKYLFNNAADGSTEHVFLRNAKDFMERCKKATTIKVDIPIYQAGRPVFTFHVDKPLVWPN
ncbi:MAG: hypothetical protein IJ659_07355 [Alloprevotella sp.]|nr:hypothetical protein [Alloprevotella sp.]